MITVEVVETTLEIVESPVAQVIEVSGFPVHQLLNAEAPLEYDTDTQTMSIDSTIFATAAQGSLADSAIQPEDLSDVATSNDYNDLDNLPTLGNSAALDVGTATGTVAAGDDTRFTDDRNPLAHADSHFSGGSDPIAPSDIGAATASQGALADTAIQPADLADVATSGLYSDLSALPTLVGIGFPLSVVTPDFVGQEYTDVTATNGARKWIATGATSADWTVATGDTGPRVIDGLALSNSWAWRSGTTGRSRIQRCGNVVTVHLWLTSTSATADAIWTIPSGFRPSAVIPLFWYVNGGGGANGLVHGATGAITSTGRSGDTYISASWITTDAWPTTLPGVAY